MDFFTKKHESHRIYQRVEVKTNKNSVNCLVGATPDTPSTLQKPEPPNFFQHNLFKEVVVWRQTVPFGRPRLGRIPTKKIATGICWNFHGNFMEPNELPRRFSVKPGVPKKKWSPDLSQPQDLSQMFYGLDQTCLLNQILIPNSLYVLGHDF